MSDEKKTSRRGQPEQQPSRRNDVIRCERCGEDYSVTYKRCPFCDERPGRTGITGKRVNEYGGPANPIQIVGLVISLVLIVAALFIVIRYVGPLIFGNRGSQGETSVSTSQSDGAVSGSASGSQSSAQEPEAPPVTVNALSLNRADFSLTAGERFQLVATVDPADAASALEWSCSDISVATIDEYGNVQNVNHDTATRTATLVASCGDKTVTCIVRCKGDGTVPGGSESKPSDNYKDPGTADNNNSDTGDTTTVTPTTPTAPTTGTAISGGKLGTVVNAGSGLNIRSGPGSTYEILASAQNGSQVKLLEDTGNGWYKVDYGNGQGYVSKSFIEVQG